MGIYIFRTGLVVCCVIAYHRIHGSGTDQKTKLWTAENLEALGTVPVRLGKYRNGISAAFQESSQKCRCKSRMVHISVTAHEDEINLINSTLNQILLAYRQKIFGHGFRLMDFDFFGNRSQASAC